MIFELKSDKTITVPEPLKAFMMRCKIFRNKVSVVEDMGLGL